jgi:4-hydroxybenzoate polyprenyltransferase
MMPPLLSLLRPHHWSKNALCLAGVFFGGQGQHLSDPRALGLALQTFAVFCLGASSVYVLNDLMDRHRDRLHPKKRHRPIASGAVTPGTAALLALVLFAAALAWAFRLGLPVLISLAAYLAVNVAYSPLLKHFALVDVLAVAFGFVARLVAGVFVVGEQPSSWIVLCTFFLAVFLAFGKRRAELANLGDGDKTQRPSLRGYTLEQLDGLVNGAGIMAIISYALFTALSAPRPTLVFTVPVVYYAIAHYQRMLLRNAYGEEPDAVLVKDGRILASVVVWLALYLLIATVPLDVIGSASHGR